jgi:hypothetical protein
VPGSLEELSVEEFKRLYYEELLTESEIAEKLGTYQVAVNRFRNRHQLPALGKTGRIERQLPDLTDLQRSLIVGSLLGDGSMTAPSSITARFSEGHSLVQREYTDWKAEIMGDYVSQRYEATKHKDGRTYESWNFSTRTTTKLRPYFDLFYETGTRVFPEILPELMTPFVLAVWYLDDGGLLQRYYPRITFGLDDLSLGRALGALSVLGFKVTVSGSDCKTLLFPGQDERFFALIQEHVPPCMTCKLPREHLRGRYKVAVTAASRYGVLASKLSASSLRAMYADELLTDEEIAIRMSEGMEGPPFDEAAVARLRRQWGISAMTSQRRSELKRGATTMLSELTAELLASLATNMSDTEIGRLYGVSKTTIRLRRRRWGISR